MKPTIKQFLVGYIVFWVMLATLCVAYIDPERPMIGITVSNFVMIFINTVGIIIGSTAKWYPWRDSP
jgi:hypothetical protein